MQDGSFTFIAVGVLFGIYGTTFLLFRNKLSRIAIEYGVRVTWPWNAPTPAFFLSFGIMSLIASFLTLSFFFAYHI